jgi:hypothetical protein
LIGHRRNSNTVALSSDREKAAPWGLEERCPSTNHGVG